MDFLEADIPISLFTLLNSSPFFHPIFCAAGGDEKVIMQVGRTISTFLFSCLTPCALSHAGILMRFLSLTFISFIFDVSLFVSVCSLSLRISLCVSHTPTPHINCLCCSFSDPGAVVETHSAVPYAVIGGVLALLVFTVICVLIVTIWCSVRQKGNKLPNTNLSSNTKAASTCRGHVLAFSLFCHIFTDIFSHFCTFWYSVL